MELKKIKFLKFFLSVKFLDYFIYLFIYFNPTSHICDFGYVKNMTQSNMQYSVIKSIYTIRCYPKTITGKLSTMQNTLYINIDNYQQCIYTTLAFKNSSSVYSELFSNFNFTSILNWLKLSSFFIFKGRHLYNLTSICSPLFWSEDVL